MEEVFGHLQLLCPGPCVRLVLWPLASTSLKPLGDRSQSVLRGSDLFVRSLLGSVALVLVAPSDNSGAVLVKHGALS